MPNQQFVFGFEQKQQTFLKIATFMIHEARPRKLVLFVLVSEIFKIFLY